MPTHVPVPADMQGLEKDSVVLLEQVRTLDKKRLGDYIGTLDRQQMMKVDKALCSSTGMRKRDKPILMCLCPICAKPFYDSKEHFIQRADKTQNLKDTCMFCNSRQGYDYFSLCYSESLIPDGIRPVRFRKRDLSLHGKYPLVLP